MNEYIATSNRHVAASRLPTFVRLALLVRPWWRSVMLNLTAALLKDAPILLLDEPTSSVDAENEELIQEALRRLARGRTTLVVAHRLSTVADADRIVVLEDGRVVESGRHAKLLAAGGAYARLVAAQQITDLEEPVFAGGDA